MEHPEQESPEKSFGQITSHVMDDHGAMAQDSSALDAQPGPSNVSNQTEKKYGFGKAPKRRNIR